jgi:hypothetical protein
VKPLMVLGVISALLLSVEGLLTPRRARPKAARSKAMNPSIVTLQEVLRHHEALPPTARAFYEALLAQGEVLAVQVDYLPDPLLWLTTTAEQARWMREQHNGAAGLESVVMSAAAAHELLAATGSPAPATLHEIAQVLLSQAPAETQSPADSS